MKTKPVLKYSHYSARVIFNEMVHLEIEYSIEILFMPINIFRIKYIDNLYSDWTHKSREK